MIFLYNFLEIVGSFGVAKLQLHSSSRYSAWYRKYIHRLYSADGYSCRAMLLKRVFISFRS